MLTALILIPLLAALALVFVPRTAAGVPRLVAMAASAITLVLGVLLFLRFDAGAGLQFEDRVEWVRSLGLQFRVGVDGLNMGLLLMSSLVAFAATAVSWDIQKAEKEFYILLLLMIGGILGAFASQDLFFLYFFHELALVPTFIMIGVWGRGEERAYATFQITLYLTVGALVALAGLILLYVKGPGTFDIPTLTEHFQKHPLPAGDQSFIFALLLFGFGILVSLWPFHTWAPVGYGSAPTGNAMLHAGVLKKFGLYGLLRIALPMLPLGARHWIPVLAVLCLGNLLHCGWVAMRQRNLNLLIGNSSVAHMGFCFLGIASLTLVGITGTVVVMIAHGLLAALSFALTGYLHARTGTLDMDKLGGLLQRLPFIGTALVIAMLAGCGVPGFANFAGELLVLFGSWKSATAGQWIVVAAAWGALIIGGVYMLRAIRSVLHGPLPEAWAAIPDAATAQRVPYAVLIAALLLFGVAPGLLTDQIRPAAAAIVQQVAPVAKPAPGTPAAAAGHKVATLNPG
jgi:NADH-quinone oxidoreductase subunit M